MILAQQYQFHGSGAGGETDDSAFEPTLGAPERSPRFWYELSEDVVRILAQCLLVDALAQEEQKLREVEVGYLVELPTELLVEC